MISEAALRSHDVHVCVAGGRCSSGSAHVQLTADQTAITDTPICAGQPASTWATQQQTKQLRRVTWMRLVSRLSVSRENLLSSLPLGWLSKKDMGRRRMRSSRFVCSFLEDATFPSSILPQ